MGFCHFSLKTVMLNNNYIHLLKFKFLNQKIKGLLSQFGISHTHHHRLLDGFFKVTVVHVLWLDYVQQMVGWFYFLAWSLSFYPQVISNYQRKR